MRSRCSLRILRQTCKMGAQRHPMPQKRVQDASSQQAKLKPREEEPMCRCEKPAKRLPLNSCSIFGTSMRDYRSGNTPLHHVPTLNNGEMYCCFFNDVQFACFFTMMSSVSMTKNKIIHRKRSMVYCQYL